MPSDVELSSIAARVRNGLLTLSCYRECYSKVQSSLESLDRVLLPDNLDWLSRTCIMSISKPQKKDRNIYIYIYILT